MDVADSQEADVQKADVQKADDQKADDHQLPAEGKKSRRARKIGWHGRRRRRLRLDGEQQAQTGSLPTPVDTGHVDDEQLSRTESLPTPLRPGHNDGEQRSQTAYLPTPTESGQPTTAEDDTAGSPKIAFSAGLPTRIASGELTEPFDIHGQQQDDLTNEEQGILRTLDVERILTSLRLLGYEVNQSPQLTAVPERDSTPGAHETVPGLLQGAAATFFHENADPLQRLWALIITFHQELDRLMPALAPQTFPYGDERRWKEEITMGLLTQISPALGRLGERVTGQVGKVLREHEAGVTFFGGRGC
ncbi:hypothetical protein LTR08_005274 [Meristemomyces frigidus]|nr:hypothetical protein LTR08_005274 [Meristemomyces frigidus]